MPGYRLAALLAPQSARLPTLSLPHHTHTSPAASTELSPVHCPPWCMQRREPVVPQLTVAELGAACYRGAYNAGVELVIQGTRAALDTQAAARLSPDLAKRLLKGAHRCCQMPQLLVLALLPHVLLLLRPASAFAGPEAADFSLTPGLPFCLLQTCGSRRCARGGCPGTPGPSGWPTQLCSQRQRGGQVGRDTRAVRVGLMPSAIAW